MHENIPDLAWYETIDYNRKDSERELENESHVMQRQIMPRRKNREECR